MQNWKRFHNIEPDWFFFFYNEPNLLLLILIQLLLKAKQGTVHRRVLWTRKGRLRYQLRMEAVKRKQIITLCSVLISQYVNVIIFAKYNQSYKTVEGEPEGGGGASFTLVPPEFSWCLFSLAKFKTGRETKRDRRESLRPLARFCSETNRQCLWFEDGLQWNTDVLLPH